MKRLIVIFFFFGYVSYSGAQSIREVNPEGTSSLIAKVNKAYSSEGLRFSKADFTTAPDLSLVGKEKYLLILNRSGSEISSNAHNNLFGRIYYNLGVNYISEHYFLKAEKKLSGLSSIVDRLGTYANLGDFYSRTGKLDLANRYYRKVLSLNQNQNRKIRFLALNAFCLNLLSLNRDSQVLPEIDKFVMGTPSISNSEQLILAFLKSSYYLQKGKLQNARDYASQAIKFIENGNLYSADCNKLYADILQKSGDFKSAIPWFLDAKTKSDRDTNYISRDFYGDIAEAYRLNKQFPQSLHYLTKEKFYRDSVIKKARQKNLLELEFQYESYKRANELEAKKLRSLNMEKYKRLLEQKGLLENMKLSQSKLLSEKQNNELKIKERSLQLLTGESNFQNNQLKRNNLFKSVSLAILILVLVIISLLYIQFRFKVKAQRLLDQKNLLLNSLAEEKTWLLREIHERVKINLDTVMTILHSRPSGLNAQTFDAMQKSENRIYAMSLIHQHLFQSDNLDPVSMKVYIPDLVNNLKNSFSISPALDVRLEIENILFDIEDAVPIGLIINEVVTNSLKYAFREDQKGQIILSLVKAENERYSLTIADNGVGLPTKLESEDSNSLGMKLIKGLSHQIGADLVISGTKGTVIMISGKIKIHSLHRHAEQSYNDTAILT